MPRADGPFEVLNALMTMRTWCICQEIMAFQLHSINLADLSQYWMMITNRFEGKFFLARGE